MIVKLTATKRFLLIRPGETDFDNQGRIKGSLDVPLNANGRLQVEEMADEVSNYSLKVIYTAPCESARQTADMLAMRQSQFGRTPKIKIIDAFRNLDHGLWHGKLIDELKRNHPKLYRHGLENADEIQPPGGETVVEARDRVIKSLNKILKKSSDVTMAIVMPDPMAGIIKQSFEDDGKNCCLWAIEKDSAHWDLIEA
jgi:broad specificity phosphatase PhoE